MSITVNNNATRADQEVATERTMRHLVEAVRAIPEGGGATLSAHIGGTVTMLSGYQVADPHLPSYVGRLEDITEQNIRYVADAAVRTTGLVGAWHNPETGELELEVTHLIDDKVTAMVLGREWDQMEIFSWADLECLTVERD